MPNKKSSKKSPSILKRFFRKSPKHRLVKMSPLSKKAQILAYIKSELKQNPEKVLNEINHKKDIDIIRDLIKLKL